MIFKILKTVAAFWDIVFMLIVYMVFRNDASTKALSRVVMIFELAMFISVIALISG